MTFKDFMAEGDRTGYSRESLAVAAWNAGRRSGAAEALLDRPGELTVGRAEIDLAADVAARAKDLEKQMAALLAATPSAQWFAQARAVMDLLASPEPPKGFLEAAHAFSAWAWLRRQAGLEGEDE